MISESFMRDFFGMKQAEACRKEQDRQNGRRPVDPLTEQRVREIIREELAKAGK